MCVDDTCCAAHNPFRDWRTYSSQLKSNITALLLLHRSREAWNWSILCTLVSLKPKRIIWHREGQFSSVQSLSRVQLFATPWTAARQASLSITTSWSSLRLASIKSVMPSSHLILSHPLLLLPPIPPSIRFFSNESTLRMRWPKYWSFSFSIIR